MPISEMYDKVGKASTCAAIAAGGTRLMDGGATVRLPFMSGQEYPLWVVAGVGAAASSAVADVAHDVILGHLEASMKFDEMTSAALALGAGGASYAGVFALADGRLPAELGGYGRLAMMGMAYELAGFYAWSNIKPMLE